MTHSTGAAAATSIPNVTLKPWGWERLIENNGRYCIKHIHVDCGKRLSLQLHEHKQETMVLLEGSAQLIIGAAGCRRTLPMVIGEYHSIPSGTIHRLCADQAGALVMEVSTPELEDVVRLEDDFGRQPEVKPN